MTLDRQTRSGPRSARVWAVFLGAILSVLALPLLAQELRAVARIDPITSSVSGTTDDLRLTLGLSQPVPYRIEARRDPDRIVIE
ncbi:hypothetical protein FGC33_03960, partial [Streptococcus pyogenes]